MRYSLRMMVRVTLHTYHKTFRLFDHNLLHNGDERHHGLASLLQPNKTPKELYRSISDEEYTFGLSN